MIQEDKDLLIKDLCARLPYGVIVHFKNIETNSGDVVLSYGNICYVSELEEGWWSECKPYLRPLSSMTEAEQLELSLVPIYARMLDNASAQIDWLNARHFDYRGLIEKGLAIAVTVYNNPYKKIEL